MERIPTTLFVLLVVTALAGASVPSSTSTTAVNRGRGARRAFIGRGGSRTARVTPAPTPTSFATTPRQQHLTAVVTPTFAPPVHHQTLAPAFSPTFSPTPVHRQTPPPTFAPTAPTFQTTFPQQLLIRVPGPTPTPRGDVFVTPRRPSPAVGFNPRSTPFFSSSAQQGQQGGRATPVPIVALKFNLRDDGSYSTSSETGDGTVRQEQGQFNGAGMSVQGMYAYRDQNSGPVQVNYVADEYGFQPQGPNIHPAIMMAVAEQVQAARSSKSRQGAKGLNGLRDDGELDYDDDNGAGTTPSTVRFKSNRAVRRVVVRRLK